MNRLGLKSHKLKKPDRLDERVRLIGHIGLMALKKEKDYSFTSQMSLVSSSSMKLW